MFEVVDVAVTKCSFKVRVKNEKGIEDLHQLSRHSVYALVKLFAAHNSGSLRNLESIGLDHNDAAKLLANNMIKYVEPLPPVNQWNGTDWYARRKDMVFNPVTITDRGAVIIPAILEAWQAITPTTEQVESEGEDA